MEGHDGEEELDPSFSGFTEENDEQEELDLVAIMKQVLINERFSPELLYYEKEVVDQLKEKVDIQQETISEEKDNANTYEDDFNFKCALYQNEIDRITYLITSYLRTRLKKIEKFCLHILMSDELVARLSEQEQAFAQGYLDLVEKQFNDAFLSLIPDKFRGLTDQTQDVDMIPKPELSQHVFLRVKEDVGMFELTEDGDQEVDLSSQDIFAASYNTFKGLLHESKIELI